MCIVHIAQYVALNSRFHYAVMSQFQISLHAVCISQSAVILLFLFSTSLPLPPPSPPLLPPPSSPFPSPLPSLPSPPPRDRVSLIWGDVSLHLSRLVLISEHDSYLRERALVGLLKIVNRLTNRDDVRSEVRTGWQFEHTYSTCTRSDCVVYKIHIRTWKYCSCVGAHRVFIQRH